MKTSDMKNPFIITGKIPEVYFCDRRKETAKLIRSITNGDNICLLSPRRMGKSKLIQFSYDKPELDKKYYTFYIDILHTSSLKEKEIDFENVQQVWELYKYVVNEFNLIPLN